MSEKKPHHISGATLNREYYKEVFDELNSTFNKIPEYGSPAKIVKKIIENKNMLDVKPWLNTSSYVNVDFEQEEEDVVLDGIKINLADQTIYPHAFKIHNEVVNMIGNLWNCPKNEEFEKNGVFQGSGTVGSTEACLLAGLTFKLRWRKWYCKKHNITEEEVLGIRPNMIISSCFQAAWEKLFRYMDIEPIIIQTSVKNFALEYDKLKEKVNDKTIGVVGILGNHWAGQYDNIYEIDKEIEKINAEKDYQIGIHVDAASGGFVAPFQKDARPWDFRLKNVLSISASGHKYGASCAGTGWIIWRHKKNLSEYVAINVTYLGGQADSYTLNFSRPASGPLVQYYKLLRFGKSGYEESISNSLNNAKFLRDELLKLTYKGKPRFIQLDNGEKNCLPVVALRLNPERNFSYNDIDLQHCLSRNNWYVSGYKMSFDHPITEKVIPLFFDEDQNQTMFRVVIKGHITKPMLLDLINAFNDSLEFLDSMPKGSDTRKLRHIHRRVITNHC